MKTKFAEMEKILRQVVKAREDNKVAIAKLEASGKNYNAEYIKSFIDPKVAEMEGEFAVVRQTSLEKIYSLIDDLAKLAEAKHAKLDLSNPAWTNALKLIELSGAGIDADTVRKINAQFANDQSALRALRDIYKANGVRYDGGLAEQIYDSDQAFESLQRIAVDALAGKNTTLNELSNAIRRVAAKEGIDFTEQVDPVGAENVMRKPAG